MDLRIDYPLALLLLIPIIGYFIWTWWHHRKQLKKRQQIVFGIRITVAILLIFSITSPYLLLPVKEEQVVFLVDRSASVEGTKEQAIAFMEESLQSKKDSHQVGIYSFASNLQTESILSDTLEHVPELSEMTSTGETNIARAIQLTTGIVDRKKATRIVLFTDGLETKGDVSDQLTKLTGLKRFH